MTTLHGGIHYGRNPATHQASPKGEWAAVQASPHTTKKSQIPSDLVVKSQATDIIDIILQLIRHRHWFRFV